MEADRVATLVEIDGKFRIQFMNPAIGKRSILYTGLSTTENRRSNESKAKALKVDLERLVEDLGRDGRPGVRSEAWIKDVGPDLRKKLERLRLVDDERDRPRTLAELLNLFLANHKGAGADATYKKWVSASNKLRTFFKGTKPLSSFKAADGKDFRNWMLKARKGLDGEAYAESHIRKTCAIAHQFFGYGIEKGALRESPFEGVPKAGLPNQRGEYVDRDKFRKVLDACPDEEFKMVLAIVRYAGLRHPSESQLLKWGDVDLDASRIRVTSPKTKIHGKSERTVPIVPALRPFLEAGKKGRDTDEWVIWDHRRENNRRLLQGVIKRAKVDEWKKLFQNLRLSCETDFAAHHPIHVVCAWMGNSPRVAIAHYLQVREEDFRKAAESNALDNASPPAKAETASPSEDSASERKSL